MVLPFSLSWMWRPRILQSSSSKNKTMEDKVIDGLNKSYYEAKIWGMSLPFRDRYENILKKVL